MSDGERCPTCGHLRREGEVRKELAKMLKGRNPPPTMAEAARRLGVSRQRAHKLAKELGWSFRKKGRKRKGRDTADQEPEEATAAPVAEVAPPEASEPEGGTEPAAPEEHRHDGKVVGYGGPGVLRQRCSCGATRRVVFGEPEEWSGPTS